MTKILTLGLLFCGFFSAYISQTKAYFPYFGTKIGSLKQLHHGVAGDVYAVDSRTLFLKNFNYDGGAPAAYFYVGNSKKPTGEGSWRLRDEKGSTSALTRRYRNSDITLLLPEGKTLRDIKWFSVWCDEFSVNFGDVSIPANLDFPRPQKIGALRGVHGVSSDNIVIVDAQTFLIPNFTYDGDAPDAKFWVGQGAKPTAQGLRIPDENGKSNPLRRYDKKTIVLTLPGFLTVFDIGHFGIWCEAFTVDFGNVRIPEGLNVPPSLKMLGISPQSKLNCEVLHDDLAFEVRWAVAGESIVVQLVAKLADNEYMSFGMSPNPQHTQMIGADVVVAWVDKQTGKGFAEDYFLDAKSQCSGKRGSCPDVKIQDNTNSIRLLNAAMVNGYSIVTYQRSLKAADRFDLPISINSSQAIIWAIGPLNERKEVSFHSIFLKDDHLINFGRQPTWNCPSSETEKDDNQEQTDADEEYYESRPQRPPQALQAETTTRRDDRIQRRPVPTPKPVAKTDGAWDIPPIQCYEPEDGVFYAQMGPTGGKHGYPAITGHVGWGISWYINGLLIPEIHVVRGKTYTFVVEGGNNPDTPAKYHPFYITDDPIGGYEYKSDEEKAGVKIYAGIHRSRTGKVTPIGVGRICNWTPDPDGPAADDFQSFGAYQRTLTLKCDQGEPGVINWTPDRNTPDTVYYHCFTHRHLGWKIHVHDRCDEGQASEIDEVIAEPQDEYIAEPSIRHETRIGPNGNFLLKHQTDLIKNHNMNGAPPKLSFELTKSSEITKLIADGIRAAEALEESISKGIVPPTQIPQVFTSATEILRGEMSAHSKNVTSVHIERPLEHLELPNIGPSAFLRPPQNVPLFRPMKPNSRRTIPIKIDRRPLQQSHRPVILPQPSVIVSHYRKPVPALMRPFIKEKPFPIKQLAPVLLLGQPSEIRKNDPILKVKQKPNGIIGVPYFDHHPQDSKLNYAVVFNGPSPIKQNKKPIMSLPMHQDKLLNKTIIYKKPFEVKEIKEDNIKVDGLKPAINEGFKPDTVVVENGFKPIVRRRTDINIGEDDERTNRRGDDPGAEIDDVMETDTLFLSQESATNAKQSFEPMFIPSPLDSTNATKIHQTISSQPMSGDLTDMDIEEGEDKVAVAAERVDTYYLPSEKLKHADSYASRPVVAYDGKAVIDASLVQPPQFDIKEISKETSGHSKIDELIRSTPQFGPFHGEIPPLNQDYFKPVENKTAIAKDHHHHHQHPITEYSNPLSASNKNHTQQISTKLTLLKAHN